MLNLDKSEIDFECPKCAQAFRKNIGWLKAHDDMVCTGCDSKIAFDKKQFTGPMNQAQKSIDNLSKQIRAFGGR